MWASTRVFTTLGPDVSRPVSPVRSLLYLYITMLVKAFQQTLNHRDVATSTTTLAFLPSTNDTFLHQSPWGGDYFLLSLVAAHSLSL